MFGISPSVSQLMERLWRDPPNSGARRVGRVGPHSLFVINLSFSSIRMSGAEAEALAAEEQAIEMFKVKKLIKSLEKARG